MCVLLYSRRRFFVFIRETIVSRAVESKIPSRETIISRVAIPPREPTAPSLYEQKYQVDNKEPENRSLSPSIHFEIEQPDTLERTDNLQPAYTHDTIVNTVIDSFIKRSNFGYQKYGTTLDRDDLSVLDWIQHAQEEHMDAILYLEKLKTYYNK